MVESGDGWNIAEYCEKQKGWRFWHSSLYQIWCLKLVELQNQCFFISVSLNFFIPSNHKLTSSTCGLFPNSKQLHYLFVKISSFIESWWMEEKHQIAGVKMLKILWRVFAFAFFPLFKHLKKKDFLNLFEEKINFGYWLNILSKKISWNLLNE